MEKVLIFNIESELDRSSAETTVNEYLDKGWTVKDIRIDRGITVFVLDDSYVPEPEPEPESDEDDDDGWW